MRDYNARLKPCPICGSRAVIHMTITSRKYFAKCVSCYCGVGVFSVKATIDEAVEAWNRRADKEGLCPFCGSEAEIQYADDPAGYYAKCVNPECKAAMFQRMPTIELARTLWNRRVNND